MIRTMIALVAVLALSAAAEGQNEPLATARSARLARGVNLSHWFWLPRDPSPDGIRAQITPADAHQLSELGLTHVRLPVEPSFLWDSESSRIRDGNLALLRRAVAMLNAGGLAVIVEAHVSRSPWADPNRGEFAEVFGAFWSDLARAMAETDPEMVFLEILNEPHGLDDPARWPEVQRRLVDRVRAVAPHHTIIATGDQWGSLDALVRLEPHPDLNIIYSFHFYEPHTFTHQGAGWGARNWPYLKGVPYPADGESIGPVIDATEDEQARGELRRYAGQGWGSKKVRQRIGLAAAWAKEHGRPVYCGEFGVYRAHSPPESRSRWLSHVVGALGEAGIGWAMWDYAGGFGMVEGQPGHRSVRQDIAEAIGLAVPSSPGGEGKPPG